MTDIIVIRGLGDKEGEDIVDLLLSTDAAALSRGQAELDLRASAVVERRIEIPYTSGLLNGQTVQIQDALQGVTYIGKITSIDHSFNAEPAPVVVTTLTLLVPSTFYV
jgi:hypothetical protein